MNSNYTMYVNISVHVCTCIYIYQALQKLNTSEVTLKGLRDMSDNVLLLVTTTIEHMQEVCTFVYMRSLTHWFQSSSMNVQLSVCL